MPPSKLEQLLAGQLRMLKVVDPDREYRFAAMHVGDGRGVKKRIADAGLKNWRFDFAWPDYRLAVEVEGGVWLPGGGRHQRGAGFEGDARKYHFAIALGWVVYRCEEKLIKSGEAAFLIRDFLDGKTGEGYECTRSTLGRV